MARRVAQSLRKTKKPQTRFVISPYNLLDACICDLDYAAYLIRQSYGTTDNNNNIINWKDPEYNSNLLHILSYSDNHIDAIKLLVNHGIEIDAVNKNNEIALHWSAKANSVFTLNFLIQCGSNKNSQDNSGSTPLHYAVCNAHLEIVSILLNEYCDINLKDKDGFTALDIAALNINNSNSRDENLIAINVLFKRHCERLGIPLPVNNKTNSNHYNSIKPYHTSNTSTGIPIAAALLNESTLNTHTQIPGHTPAVPSSSSSSPSESFFQSKLIISPLPPSSNINIKSYRWNKPKGAKNINFNSNSNFKSNYKTPFFIRKPDDLTIVKPLDNNTATQPKYFTSTNLKRFPSPPRYARSNHAPSGNDIVSPIDTHVNTNGNANTQVQVVLSPRRRSYFPWFPVRTVQSMDVIVSVEQCCDCEQHNWGLRHDADRYDTAGTRALTAILDELMIMSSHSSTGCYINRVYALKVKPESQCIGALEVNIAVAVHIAGGVINWAVCNLHSKLESKTWPVVESLRLGALNFIKETLASNNNTNNIDINATAADVTISASTKKSKPLEDLQSEYDLWYKRLNFEGKRTRASALATVSDDDGEGTAIATLPSTRTRTDSSPKPKVLAEEGATARVAFLGPFLDVKSVLALTTHHHIDVVEKALLNHFFVFDASISASST